MVGNNDDGSKTGYRKVDDGRRRKLCGEGVERELTGACCNTMFDPRVDMKEKPSPYGGAGDAQPGVHALHHEGLKQPRSFAEGDVQLIMLQVESNVPVQVRLWSPTSVMLFPSTLPSPPATPCLMWNEMLNVSAPVGTTGYRLFCIVLVRITHGAPVISHPA